MARLQALNESTSDYPRDQATPVKPTEGGK